MGVFAPACDYTLEQQATEVWLAEAFDLSRVPGDKTVPPLERMLADDRDVFVPDYPAGSYRAQIDAIREGTLIVVPGEPRQPLNEINWSEAEFGDYYATKLHCGAVSRSCSAAGTARPRTSRTRLHS